VLFHNECDLKAELEWLNPLALKFLKNYQIWHHRQMVVDKLGSCEGETDFIECMMEGDAKNYHVWSYRQWLVKRFGLWDKGEIEAVEELLERDVRNNSAWNHRWYVVFGRPDGEQVFGDKDVVTRELQYTKKKVRLAPQNESPWNYIRGMSRKAKGSAAVPLTLLKEFAEEFASIEEPEKIRSSHALDLLADIYAEEGKKEDASKGLELLASKYDPIRANYWNWRKSLLDGKAATGVQASA
jgi:protein farnesyltransferase/geranylgeranyltransferase type-1 subunit alpha